MAMGTTGLAGCGVGLRRRDFVVGVVLGDEIFLAVVAEEAGGDGDGAAGVEDMDDGLRVVGAILTAVWARLVVAPPTSSGMRKPWRSISRATWTISSSEGVMRPLRPMIVGVFGAGALEDFFGRDHDTHVDDLVVVAGEHDADDVLADVVDVALDGGEDDLALGLDDLLPEASSSAFSASM